MNQPLPLLSLPLFIRQTWRESRSFRWLFAASMGYLILRLALQAALLFDPASQEIAADLQIYLNAARAFLQRQDLYPAGMLSGMNFYQYAPFYALTFQPFLLLSPLAVAVVHTLLHLLAYVALYFVWGRIFHRLGLREAQYWMAWSLPVWVIFSAFWGDLSYLNIYLIVALLASLLVEAVLEERLGWSALWLVLILQVKPYWAFAALVPLLLGRRAFFLRLMGLALLGYLSTVLVSLAFGGSYAARQYADYLSFLPRLSGSFPWRGPESGFLGYNHSVKQVVVFWLGVTPGALAFAGVLKLGLLLPLAWVVLDSILHPVRLAPQQAGTRFLDLCFALYLGAFIWLDMVWELSLGIVVFVYLLALVRQRAVRALIWGVFLFYALVDLWQIGSYLIFGSQILIQDAYLSTDPSIYVPVILITNLLFYGLLLGRLGRMSLRPWRAVQWKLNNS